MSVRSALQINMHPLDARHACHTLPHQLEVWGGQVDRVVLTVDTRRSRNGRYRGAAYEENSKRLFALLEGFAKRDPKISIAEVDYSPAAREAVRQRYFATSKTYPEKAFDGGPMHAYFYGLLEGRRRLHRAHGQRHAVRRRQPDLARRSDRLAGANPDALFAGPLPGPPRADGSLADLHRSLGQRAQSADSGAAAGRLSRLPLPEREHAHLRSRSAPLRRGG